MDAAGLIDDAVTGLIRHARGAERVCHVDDDAVGKAFLGDPGLQDGPRQAGPSENASRIISAMRTIVRRSSSLMRQSTLAKANAEPIGSIRQRDAAVRIWDAAR